MGGLKKIIGHDDSFKKQVMGRNKKRLPEQPEEKPMPTPDDDQIRQAKRQSLKRQRRRKGRASTILTEDSLG